MKRRLPSVRRIDRQTAELIRDAVRVLTFCVAPVAFVTFETVAVLARTGHIAAAWLTIAVVFIAGIAIARTTSSPARSRHSQTRPASVRRINRRAARILPAAAVLLAGLLQLVATHGLVPLVALAYVAIYAGVMMFAGWVSWHLPPACVRLVAAARARRHNRDGGAW